MCEKFGIEALPGIQIFNGTTFVVKDGGSFMDSPDPEERIGVARLWIEEKHSASDAAANLIRSVPVEAN